MASAAPPPTSTALALTRLIETDAHEGPVYVADEDALYFTTLPSHGRTAIRRLRLEDATVETVREPSRRANGMTLGHDGRLVVCEQGTLGEPAAIAAVDRATGRRETLVDGWRGAPLNSPNDVVVRSDGTIWFTDPSYGFLQGFRPQPRLGDYVYRFDPGSGAIDPVADGYDKPNGLAFSPDEAVLYVGDSGTPHHVVAHDVLDGRRLGPARLFAVIEPGFPDGLKVDVAGRVYVSCSSGVLVYAPDGDLLGEIDLPGAVNFAFGGRDEDLLFITTDTAIWAATAPSTGA